MAVVLLLATQGAQATPALWQVKATKTNSGTTNNTVFSKANVAGNLIVVHVLWGNAGAVTLSDTSNNSYTPVGPVTRFDNNQYSSQMFYAKDIAAAPANANTLRATFATSISNWSMVYAHEYSGMDKLSPVDVFGTTTGTGTSLSGSLTTHQNNSLIFAATIASDSSITNADSSYTVHSKLSQDWTMSKVQATAGTVNATATRAGSGLWIMQMVAFKPEGIPPQNQPPTVLITNPANGTLTKGTVDVSATASDPENNLLKVDFFVDGVLATTDTTAPYQFSLDTTTLGNSTHSLTAKASDGTNETTSAPVQITVDNAAPSTPNNLHVTNLTSSQATVAWDAATDNLAVGGYKVFKDGAQIATTAGTSYQLTGLAPSSTYNVMVSAYDTVGNESSQTAPLPVTTLPDIDPQVSITSPADGATVRATVPVTVTATDDVNVTQVELWVDGQLVIADNAAPYEFTLNTPALTDGLHTIMAKAYDTLGQSTESAVTVTVDNLAPAAPTDLAATVVSSSAIDLSWTASTGDVAYYKVFRNGSEVAPNVTVTNYSDTGLTPNTTYNYAVEAYDVAGNQSPATTVSATTLPAPDTTPPAVSNGQPTGTLASGTTTATLTVTTNENASCRYATVAGGSYSAMADSFTSADGTNHSAVVSGLADGQSYTYFVRCQDQATNANTADYGITFSVANPSNGTIAFPLRASANGKYLEDQNGTPFLIMGDSPQGIIPSLTLSQVDSYLANRQSYGFNTLWINLLSRGQTGGPNDGATVEGDRPFTDYLSGNVGNPEYYNLDARNEAYFTKAKEVISKAAEQDMLVILDPIETMDFLGVLQRNGQLNAYEYGQYLGDTFQEFDNIIWMHGNDFNTYMNDTDRTLVRKIGEGIRDRDNPNAMQTVLGYASPSEAMDLVYDPNPDDTAWAPLINIDTVYTYGPAYEYVANEYARAASYSDGSYSRGRIPVYLAETYYDFEDMVPGRSNRPIKEFRWQQYWAMLSGAAGHTYGNYDSVYLDGNWAPKLDTPAAANFSRWNQFFKSYPWYDLQPDQSLITAGADGGDWNLATAAITQNGSLGMAYVPNARGITINMARFSGPVTAQWFNPVTGAYTAFGTFGNVGTQQFTPISLGSHNETNWYGGNETSSDWVLVLQVGNPDTEAPSVPTNLIATAASSSQINLTWTASTDNVGVTGYKVYRDGVLVNGNVTGTTYQDTGLSPSTTYSYTVSAFDGMNNTSAQSASSSATTQSPPPPDTTPPSAPTNLTAGTVTTTQVPLSWAASTDPAPGSVAGYHVFRCQGAGCTTFSQVTGSLVAATNYTDTGLSAGTTYRYKVVAVDSANNMSADSNLLSVTTQNSSPVSAFLMAAWNFNEGTGTTAADFTANGNLATLSGASWVTGKYGSGLTFNGGSSSHLSVANSPSLNISGSEMTISVWMNPLAPSTSDTVVLGKFWNTGWTDPYFQYGLEMASGNRPTFIIGTTTGYRAAVMSSAVTYGQWTHVGVTFNGTQVKFYINGVLTDTQSLTGTITARNNSMHIGSDQANGQGFKGILDDIRIYNKALSQAEIANDMNALQ